MSTRRASSSSPRKSRGEGTDIRLSTSVSSSSLSPRKPQADKLASLRVRLDQDIVLFRLACLTTSSKQDAEDVDDYADVVGEWRLGRFLQSVDGDVDLAVKAVQDHFRWRLSVSAEKIRGQVQGRPFRISSCPHAEVLVAAGLQKPCVNAGLSRLGDVVHLESIGQADAKGMLQKVTEDQLLEHYVGFFELRSRQLETLSAAEGHIVRSVQIRDMSSFGFHLLSERSAIAALQSLVKVGAENYPESTAYAIFTRAPGVFTSAWGLVSRVLPARTVKKVRFVNFADTPSTLMRYVQPHSIVALQRLGWGEDGDVICDDIENNVKHSFERTVQVAARGSEHIYIALNHGQKCVFRLFDGPEDVTAFADVLYVANDQNEGFAPDDVVVHTECTSTRGSVACPSLVPNCLVVIHLDNTASWFSGKAFQVDVKIT